MTLREAITRAAARLDASPGLRADAARDATLLLLHATNISRAALLADAARALTQQQYAAYDDMVNRRLANEPIQYILGEQEFFGLTLRVTPAVLIPRPETEHLVEAVLSEFDASATIRILDIGTGSGAIAIALAHKLPYAFITATDISTAALEVAAANAAHHHLADRIRFVESDLLAAFGNCGEAFDAIVSNPPYIPAVDRETLHPQVRDFEPAIALFAGVTGLEIYRRLIPPARAALKPSGLLVLEMGHGQRDDIAALLAGWKAIRFVNDLQGIPRIALACKP